MTTRTRFLLTLIAAATLLTGLAAAQPDGERPLGPRLMKALDLTEAQAERIEALREDHRDSMKDRRKQMMRLRHELKGLMLEDDVDDAKVLNLTRKVGDMRTEFQVARAEMRLQVREVLTEEQRDRMMAMKHRRGAKGRGDDCEDGRGRKGRPGRQGDRGPRGERRF